MSKLHIEDSDLVQDHVQDITEKELDLIILKMGSYLSIINNKKINQAKLLIELVKNEKFKSCFLKTAEINNLQCLVRYIIERYPTLCESKVVINAIKKP